MFRSIVGNTKERKGFWLSSTTATLVAVDPISIPTKYAMIFPLMAMIDIYDHLYIHASIGYIRSQEFPHLFTSKHMNKEATVVFSSHSHKMLVITFETTTAAIMAENCFKSLNLSGRIIPLPSEISAGCGLAWQASSLERMPLITALKERKLTFEGVYVLDR